MILAFGFVCAAFFVTSVRSVRADVQNVCTVGYIISGLTGLGAVCLS